MHDPNIRMKAFEAARELMLHYHDLGAGTVADRLTDLLLTSRSIEAYLDGSDSFAGGEASQSADKPDNVSDNLATYSANGTLGETSTSYTFTAHDVGTSYSMGTASADAAPAQDAPPDDASAKSPRKQRTPKPKKAKARRAKKSTAEAEAPSHESGNPVPESGSHLPGEPGQDLPQAA